MWQVRWRNRAEADLDSLSHRVRERVLASVRRLAETGHGDLSKLRGREAEWRLRVGDWRVRLTFIGDSRTIEVLRVQHRREAYR